MITNNLGKTYKLVKSLSQKKYRDKLNLFVVEGRRFVSEIPESLYIEFYVYTDAFINKNDDFKFRKNVRNILCDERVFASLSETESPQGIIAVCKKICYDEQKLIYDNKTGTYLILEELKDPGNLGTIIRTACASGVTAIFLSRNTTDLYNPKVLRSTMGAIFNIPVVQNICMEQLLKELKSKGVTIIGTSPRANVNYYEAALDNRTAIIIGREDSGMSKIAENNCDKLVKIPISRNVESLNASVAASVLMYEALRQRNAGRVNAFDQTNI